MIIITVSGHPDHHARHGDDDTDNNNDDDNEHQHHVTWSPVAALADLQNQS